jgi:hypothetical protein
VHISDICGDAVVCAPTDRAGVAGLIDSLQQLAAVNRSSVRDAEGRGKEPQDNLTRFSRHAVAPFVRADHRREQKIEFRASTSAEASARSNLHRSAPANQPSLRARGVALSLLSAATRGSTQGPM